jgi:hypothetical protein
MVYDKNNTILEIACKNTSEPDQPLPYCLCRGLMATNTLPFLLIIFSCKG